MDIVERLPQSKEYNSLMVMADRLSKYGHFIPLSHPYKTKKIAKIFITKIVRLHGFPRSTMSDRDKIFVSSFWVELCADCSSWYSFKKKYHLPSSNGWANKEPLCRDILMVFL